MKKFLALLMLISLVAPAGADDFSICRRWVDENGFERVRCDKKLPPYITFASPVGKRERSLKDLEIREEPPGSGNYVIFNSVDHSYTFCSKFGDGITCR